MILFYPSCIIDDSKISCGSLPRWSRVEISRADNKQAHERESEQPVQALARHSDFRGL